MTTAAVLSPVDAFAPQIQGNQALPVWKVPTTTKEPLDWVSLETIDLNDLDSNDPSVRANLISRSKHALSVDGFLYVIGTGVTQEIIERQLAIAQHIIQGIADEEKVGYTAKLSEGSYRGHKPKGIWSREGVVDNIEHYNFETPSFDGNIDQHPPSLRSLLPEIQAFADYTYNHIVRKILEIISLVLELPSDALWKLHSQDGVIGDSCQRYMGYHPRSQEDEEKTKHIWSKGHTDYNTISLLFSQPIAALQILRPDNKWKWVQHRDGAIVVNVADALDFLTGGVLKATRHRVIRPPTDQSDITRLILIHFARARGDLVLNPLYESPIVGRDGVHAFQDRIDAGERAPTQAEWLAERIKRTGHEKYTEDKKPDEGKVQERVLGRKVDYYV
ncbi:Clavaminate synthase-like protein [Desarmillaria ectypa]|nr:Clavaminate synthase-like protein [Desarmillaria ectypa]